MNKLYNKQTWHNNTTPAINEDNLNHIEDGIDAIDSRLVEISGTLMETIPEILEMYDDIETLTKNPPYIGTNGNWYVWDTETGTYVDSGVDASITVTIADVTMIPSGAQPYVTNTGTNTDPVFHLFIPYGETGGVTGVKGSAESTYRSGDVNLTKANIGLGNVDNTSDLNKPISTATQTALDGKVPNTRTVNDHALSSNVSITASDVGLGNVDNTSDANKPVSTATQTALNGKFDKTGGRIDGDITLGGTSENPACIFAAYSDSQIGDSTHPITYGYFDRIITTDTITADGSISTTMNLDVGGNATIDGNLEISGDLSTGNIDNSDHAVTIAGVTIEKDADDNETAVTADNLVGDISASTAAFTQDSTRANINSGESIGTLFGRIKKWFADLGDLAFLNKDGASSTKFLRGDGTWQTVASGVTGVKGNAESSYRTGDVNITKANIGLGNVDNTSDANKPISTATQTALDGKVGTGRKVNGHTLDADVTVTASDVGAIPTTQKGTNSGVAELDSNGKVPSSQLPSYVDDVLEYSSQSAFPSTGESGKIYVATDTNKTYRWSGTAYVEISPSLALGETSSTAYRGDRGKTAYDHASETKAGQTASGLYKVASTAQGHISSLTAVQKSDITALGIPGQDTTYTGTGLISINSSNVISTTAEVNQNAFSNVKVGSTTVAADAKQDTLELAAGSNITLTPDATNDKVTIAATDTTYSNATQSAAGLMSSTDKTKLDGVATGAEVNQNAFANVKVGSSTVAADSKTDTLELVAGSNVTLTPDPTNDKVLIAATDTKYSTMSSSELTTGTATTARSVRADYLKTGVDSLIDTKINALDGGTIGTPSASKTLTALSETNGQVSATFGNIAIAESQVTNLVTDLAAKLPLSGGTMTGDITLGSNGDTYASIIPGASGECYLGDTSHSFDHAYIEDLNIIDDVTVGGKVTVTGNITAANLGTASAKNVPSSGNASTSQVVMGNDTRLSDARNAADVSAWAKAASKPTYTKSEVGLGNVDNTSDANKPISTATQTALNGKANTSALTDGSVTKIGTATVGSSTQPVYINGGVPTAAGYLMTRTSATVASSGWTAESYTSPSGTVYGYKKDVTISGMTASSYIDGDISSGTYTGAYAFESASGKATIRTATQPSSSLTFRLYYQI